jgi:hypothetical protein
LAVISAPFALQAVDSQDFMDNLMSGKKNAKKLKKTLYIYREKGQNVFRCLRKAQSKKR